MFTPAGKRHRIRSFGGKAAEIEGTDLRSLSRPQTAHAARRLLARPRWPRSELPRVPGERTLMIPFLEAVAGMVWIGPSSTPPILVFRLFLVRTSGDGRGTPSVCRYPERGHRSHFLSCSMPMYACHQAVNFPPRPGRSPSAPAAGTLPARESPFQSGNEPEGWL